MIGLRTSESSIYRLNKINHSKIDSMLRLKNTNKYFDEKNKMQKRTLSQNLLKCGTKIHV